ncbi:myosin-G heavy chain [Condylostylus longicornis]|uniref:myosin-G heavy chain n=1 Tax=Condylostylus longicornis TaxID=2530218 RepID=UPI00244DC326|nr:myosin-G heavy chain [Condylostylus longicornis]
MQHLTLQQQQQLQLQLKQQHSILNKHMAMSHTSVIDQIPKLRQLKSKASIDLVNYNNGIVDNGENDNINVGTNIRTSYDVNNDKNNDINNLLSSDSLTSESDTSLILSDKSDNGNLKSLSIFSNNELSSSNKIYGESLVNNISSPIDNALENSDSNNNNNNNLVNNNSNNVNKQQQQQTDASLLDEMYNTPMYFGTENNTVITTQIGATAHMPCAIHHIGDGVVSWIRRKDYHLLTVGLTTYNSDERFSATHLKHSEDWTLQIKFVQLRDAGIYECQVSTHPPTSIFLNLNVVEARAEISGPSIRYLTPGSTLRLQCHVLQNTQPSEFIFWYHDNRMINYDIDRGINVSTEADFQSSELVIQRTRREHSGNFTCLASNAQPASVLVHIFKGDNPAAMYHGHVGSSNKSYQNQFFVNLLLTISIGKSLLYHSCIKVFQFL